MSLYYGWNSRLSDLTDDHVDQAVHLLLNPPMPELRNCPPFLGGITWLHEQLCEEQRRREVVAFDLRETAVWHLPESLLSDSSEAWAFALYLGELCGLHVGTSEPIADWYDWTLRNVLMANYAHQPVAIY